MTGALHARLTPPAVLVTCRFCGADGFTIVVAGFTVVVVVGGRVVEVVVDGRVVDVVAATDQWLRTTGHTAGSSPPRRQKAAPARLYLSTMARRAFTDL